MIGKKKDLNPSSSSTDLQNAFKHDKFDKKYLINTSNHNVYIEKTDDSGKEYKYVIEISVDGFEPDDFSLKLKGRNLQIKATRQILNKNEANNRQFYDDSLLSNLKEFEEFKRDINLPDYVLLDSVVCYLETYEYSQNILLIEGIISLHEMGLKNLLSNHVESRKKHSFRSNEKNFSYNNNNFIENYSTNGYLKYKFDLKNFESKDISLSIKNKRILLVNAFKESIDSNGNKIVNEFNREISLPKNIELHNIKNCFDEYFGILRIEIPLGSDDFDKRSIEYSKSSLLDEKRKSKSTQSLNNKDNKENYLELVFDLYDFKFENLEFEVNEQEKNILIVKAYKNVLKTNSSNESTKSSKTKQTYNKKYLLPDWVSTEDIVAYEEVNEKHGKIKNLLILNLPIIHS